MSNASSPAGDQACVYPLPRFRWPAARTWLAEHAAAGAWRLRDDAPIDGLLLLEFTVPDLRQRLHAHLDGLLTAALAADPAADIRILGQQDLKLNIEGAIPAPGWTLYRSAPGPGVDLIGRPHNLHALANDSVIEVYAAHVLNRLGRIEELAGAVSEYHRVLRPGGVLRVSVPDVAALTEIAATSKADGAATFRTMRAFFGTQTEEAEVYRSGFDFDGLHALLAPAGFERIGRVRSFGHFIDASERMLGGRSISLNVEAFKPAAPH